MKQYFILLLLILITPFISKANDTLTVSAFKQVKIYTDPSKGYNAFSQWTNFPTSNKSFKKVTAKITFQCPDSLHCGEWDYTGTITLKRFGSKKNPENQYEIARMMSPYGWNFASDWKFSWTVDVTDFATLLKDSVEIEYTHYGYENAKDRGWLVSIDFEFIEGNPIRSIKRIDKIWFGNYPFGDSLVSINQKLEELKTTNQEHHKYGRIRIIQTGHGMDSKENCAEFCPKTRQIIYNKQCIDARKIWKECGDNPLYPQAGTWLYDRANWCPGSVVSNENIDFKLDDSDSIHIQLLMEEYHNKPMNQAHYTISGYLFLYKLEEHQRDATIERIISPSIADEDKRMNPSNTFSLLVTNNGKRTIRHLQLKLSVSPSTSIKQLNWKGKIKPKESKIIYFQNTNLFIHNTENIIVELIKINHLNDQDISDNKTITTLPKTEVLPQHFILEVKANDSTQGLSYQLRKDDLQLLAYQKGSIQSGAIHRDTLKLEKGFYTFSIVNPLGMGLEFWAEPQHGYGTIRIYDTLGVLIKTLKSDFGNQLNYFFQANDALQPSKQEFDFPLVTIFPRTNNGFFKLDFVAPSPQNFTIQIQDNTSKAILFQTEYKGITTQIIPIQLPELAENRYTFILKTTEKEIKRNIRIKRN